MFADYPVRVSRWSAINFMMSKVVLQKTYEDVGFDAPVHVDEGHELTHVVCGNAGTAEALPANLGEIRGGFGGGGSKLLAVVVTVGEESYRIVAVNDHVAALPAAARVGGTGVALSAQLGVEMLGDSGLAIYDGNNGGEAAADCYAAPTKTADDAHDDPLLLFWSGEWKAPLSVAAAKGPYPDHFIGITESGDGGKGLTVSAGPYGSETEETLAMNTCFSGTLAVTTAGRFGRAGTTSEWPATGARIE